MQCRCLCVDEWINHMPVHYLSIARAYCDKDFFYIQVAFSFELLCNLHVSKKYSDKSINASINS
jgi:hypothetical protein